MSIINDALKKVQANIDKKTGPPAIGRDQDLSLLQPPRRIQSLLNTDKILPTIPKEPKKNLLPEPQTITSSIARAILPAQQKENKILIFLGVLITVILILLAGYQFYLFGLTRVDLNPGAKRHTFDHIIVQGIMTNEGKNTALINDEIYEAGQTVMGKKIMNISVDSVQILDRRKLKTLKVK